MKLFALLISLTCFVIDNSALAKSKDDKEREENDLRNALESHLNVSIRTKCIGIWGASINNCAVYQTDKRKLMFVKDNTMPGSKEMFEGEKEGLKAICETKTILAPYPISTGHTNVSRHFLVMQYLNITKLTPVGWSKLGRRVANMHMFNLKIRKSSPYFIKRFGFHVGTTCGVVPQNNTWTDDWITFFIENRMTTQIEVLRSYMNTECPTNTKSNQRKKRKVIEVYWPRLKTLIPKFFEGIDVKPSLLHGDLWFGNIGQVGPDPVIFDPAAFYGHHEYDIAITTLYGIFTKRFHDTYFKKIPKAKGFENREQLYHLCHLLNHWNHNYVGTIPDIVLEVFERLFKMFRKRGRRKKL